jgi:hypothetical protein
MRVTMLHPRAEFEDLGMLPLIFLESDPRPLREQVEDRYRHGGGYHSMGNGFEVNPETKALHSTQYPDDRPFAAVLEIRLDGHDEWITLYTHGIVRIAQADGSFDVIRMD